MLCTAATMAVATIVATQASANPIAATVAAALFGLAAGVLASLGPAAIVIGLQALVALAVFSQFHVTIAEAGEMGALVFGGGLLQTLLLVVVWPLAGFATERNALAAAFRALGTYAAAFPGSDLQAPSSAPIAALGNALSDPQPFARRAEIAAFESLFVEATRIRTTLGTLATDRYLLDRDGRADAALAVATLVEGAGPIFLRMAEALERGEAPDDWDDSWESLALKMERLQIRGPQRTVDDARALLGQLRAAWRATESPAGGAPDSALAFEPPSLPSRFAMALQKVRANCSPRSEFAQHGLRLGITVGIATLLAHELPLARGYWIPLTATLVLRPDFATTYSRGVARLIGTLAGSVVASLVVAVFHPGAQLHFVLALAFAAISYVVFTASYSMFTTAITGYVVFLLAFGGLPEHTALVDRIEATVVGGALALCAYAFWPTWEREIVPVRLAELVEAQRAYRALVFGAFIAGGTLDERRLNAAQAQTWRARSNAEASVDRMLNEPVRPTVLTVRAALGILAASRQVGIASLTLRARLGEVRESVPELRELDAALDESLAAVARALRERGAPEALAPLRDLQLAFAEEARAANDTLRRTLISETDLMVDGTNAMADILRRLHAGDSAQDSDVAK